MKKFTSCFIGISLPTQYQQEFELLLKHLTQIDPQLEIVYSNTPHITACYLDDQSQLYLSEITEDIKSKLRILKGTSMIIDGFGYFVGATSQVVFLDVIYSDSFKKFNRVLKKTLEKFHAIDYDLPFHPHLTVGKFKTPISQQSFDQFKLNVQIRANKIKWQFPITEVVIYGADSTKQPEYQEKLITLEVK